MPTVSVVLLDGGIEKFAYKEVATIQNLKDVVAVRMAMDTAKIRFKLASCTCLKAMLLVDVPAGAHLRVNKVCTASYVGEMPV